MKTLVVAALTALVAFSALAEDSSHKARIDELTRQLRDAAAANDRPRVQRIADELKRESDAAAREIQGKMDEHAKRPDVQAMKKQAQDSANAIQATTETLEYKIMKAAQKGDLAEVRRLRAQGADLNTINGLVAPPLFSAANRGDVPMATFLVAEGAKVQLGEGARARNAVISAVDVMSNTTDNSAMIRFLASKGADINYRFGGEYVPTGDPRKDAILQPRYEKMRGDSPIMFAVRKNHMAHLRTLLSLHANPNLFSMGQTPLQVAQRQNNAEAMRLLTAAGAH